MAPQRWIDGDGLCSGCELNQGKESRRHSMSRIRMVAVSLLSCLAIATGLLMAASPCDTHWGVTANLADTHWGVTASPADTHW
jgi:hypothetical protein